MPINHTLKKQEVSLGSSRVRNQKYCRICKSVLYGPEIHYQHFQKHIDLKSLARAYVRKLGYKRKQSLYAFQRTLIAHFDEDHCPGWLAEVERIFLKRALEQAAGGLSRFIIKLNNRWKKGEIADNDYLGKTTALLFTIRLLCPGKISVLTGPEAIKLRRSQELMEAQRSEATVNLMRIFSGLPDNKLAV